MHSATTSLVASIAQHELNVCEACKARFTVWAVEVLRKFNLMGDFRNTIAHCSHMYSEKLVCSIISASGDRLVFVKNLVKHCFRILATCTWWSNTVNEVEVRATKEAPECNAVISYCGKQTSVKRNLTRRHVRAHRVIFYISTRCVNRWLVLRAAMSNPNGLLSLKLYHYLNLGHTLNDILMRAAHWTAYFYLSKLN